MVATTWQQRGQQTRAKLIELFAMSLKTAATLENKKYCEGICNEFLDLSSKTKESRDQLNTMLSSDECPAGFESLLATAKEHTERFEELVKVARHTQDCNAPIHQSLVFEFEPGSPEASHGWRPHACTDTCHARGDSCFYLVLAHISRVSCFNFVLAGFLSLC